MFFAAISAFVKTTLTSASVSQIYKFSSQTEADFYFMNEAFVERMETDDPKGKIVLLSAVGTVIADRSHLLARSANVLPPSLKHLYSKTGKQVTEEDRYHLIEHAERAAIFKAFRAHADLSKATLYCTRFPCSDCARAIVWSGIKRTVFAGGFAGEKKWLSAQRAALRILRDGNVTVRYLTVRAIPDELAAESSNDLI
jgi:deoxycytidylate deaminase